MKNKKISQYQDMDRAELVKNALEMRKKINELQIQAVTKPSKNVREKKMLRKNLAVILTFIRQKEISHG